MHFVLHELLGTVDELKLSVGQSAYAVIKASDVMVGID
jgi:molybdopterin-binding protein